MKSIRTETNEILIACAARRSQNLQIVTPSRFAFPGRGRRSPPSLGGGVISTCEVAKVARGEANESRR
jgi:hypothetical protein